MEGNGSAPSIDQRVMNFPGISPVVSYPRIGEGILHIAECILYGIRIFCVLYKRLVKATKFAWFFFLAEVVSAQVPGRRTPNVELYSILPRSATP